MQSILASELLGHQDAHVPNKGGRGVRSPLDDLP